jgi:penicillin-binding protein 1A
MGEAEAYLTTSLLASVIDHGTGASARSVGRPLAGKTGTSNQAKDGWFIGYSTDIVCATWTGYDDARSLGAREAGATAALPAWIAFMKAAHDGKPPTEFPRPAGVITARIDPATGLLAYEGEQDAMEEAFLDGTVPDVTSAPDAGAGADAGFVVGTAVADEPEAVDAGTADREEPPPF